MARSLYLKATLVSDGRQLIIKVCNHCSSWRPHTLTLSLQSRASTNGSARTNLEVLVSLYIMPKDTVLSVAISTEKNYITLTPTTFITTLLLILPILVLHLHSYIHSLSNSHSYFYLYSHTLSHLC